MTKDLNTTERRRQRPERRWARRLNRAKWRRGHSLRLIITMSAILWATIVGVTLAVT